MSAQNCSNEFTFSHAQIHNSTTTSIAFKNVSYEINEFELKNGFMSKQVLQNLSGHFEGHSLNGLIGPSGAGKTTLLNCLNGNFEFGQNSQIFLNCETLQNAKVLSFFIEQHVHETVVDRMTVRDIFRYAFKFKNSKTDGMSDWIDQIMHELMLPSELLERQFGKCSGGEQKRIAIAQELMSLQMPAFLFLDEPTTRLDSVSALEVVNCLRNLTKKYRLTVIASIHAPNSEILARFDQIYVLAKSGLAIYSGVPENIKTFFETEIPEFKIYEDQPPIEALITIASNSHDDGNVLLTKLATKCSQFQEKQLNFTIQNEPSLQLVPNGFPNRRKHFSVQDLTTELSRQFKLNFITNFRQFFISNSTLLFLFYFVSTFFSQDMAVHSGCIALQVDELSNSTNCREELNQNSLMRENIIFMWYTFLFMGFFVTCVSAIFISPFIKVYRNEHRNNWYSFGVFYLSTSIINLLEVTSYSTVVVLMSYFSTHQHSIDSYHLNWHRLTLYFTIICLYCVFMQAIGQLIGIVFLNYIEIAISLASIANATMTVFNQLFLDLDRSDKTLLITISNWIGVKSLVKALIYTFYGIGRCDSEGEISIYMLNYDVNEQKIEKYFFSMIVDIVAIRLLTWTVMFCSLNSFKNVLRNWWSSKSITILLNNFIKILPKSNSNSIQNHDKITNVETNVQTNEEFFKYDEFLRDKIIVGFRNLTLFKRTPFYYSKNNNFGGLKENDTILRDLNGEFKFGTLNGLMGTSGSGKTSLLRVLNGQCKSRLSQSTRIYLSRHTKIVTCFIAQEVSRHLMSGLTAKQSLLYASRLKNIHSNHKQVNHSKNAQNWLTELEMAEIGDTKVENCSGGERKRLALALELTALELPNLICIDEPTSGLDSNSALIVISCFRKLTTKHNITILASIHQPNNEILHSFEHLFVLALGGECIFTGTPDRIQSHLDDSIQISKQKVQYSTFALESLLKYSCCNSQEDSQVQKLVKQINLTFSNESLLLGHDTQLSSNGVGQNRVRFHIRSVGILLQRYFTYLIGHYWKECSIFYFLYLLFDICLTYVFDRSIALPSGCLNVEDDFNSTCASTSSTAQQLEPLIDNCKYTFMMANMFLLLQVFQNSLSFRKDLHFFSAQHHNGWYSTGAFYAATRITEIVLCIPLILMHVYVCNYYETIRPGIYYHFVLILLLASLSIQPLAHLYALLSKGSFVLLIIITVLATILSVLLSNIFVHLHGLNYVYKLLANFSILRFTFESFILLQYGFGRCEGSREIQPLLFMMQIEDSDYYHCLIMLTLNAVMYQLVAIVILVNRVNNNYVENYSQRMDRITNYNRKLCPSINIVPGL